VFEGFDVRREQVGGVALNCVIGGHGAPVLLLHGYPQTHICWHRVAPLLSKNFTVVCPGLKGYGGSDKPFGDAGHRAYSKRTLAQEQFELMQRLGFKRFAVVGHDRGGRVARRLALDHREAVSHLAVLDIVPTAHIYATLSQERALSVWRYFFLPQPFPLPEKIISAARETYLRSTLEEWSGTPGVITEAALSEYIRCFDNETIHATCEDYRAGASIDLEDDGSDENAKVTCPLLALWSKDGIGADYDVAEVWRKFTTSRFRGVPIDSGHFLAEEKPECVVAQLEAFLGVTQTATV
jgi:haloacetate dehalogenase